MKSKLIAAILFMLSVLPLSAQWTIGLRDTRYVYAEYAFLKNWSAKFEQSVYSEKLDMQYFRLYFGYNKNLGRFNVSATPFYGMVYGGSYYNMGLKIAGDVNALKWLDVNASVAPFYDSGLKYSTLYSAGLSFNVTKEISVLGSFTNYPEYRMPEKRIRAGFRFRVKNLSVQPELSIPTSSTEGKNLRVLASMSYTF